MTKTFAQKEIERLYSPEHMFATTTAGYSGKCKTCGEQCHRNVDECLSCAMGNGPERSPWAPNKGERVGYNVGAGMREGTFIGKSTQRNGFYFIRTDDGRQVAVMFSGLYKKSTAGKLYKAA